MNTENKILEDPRALAEEITKIVDSKKAKDIKLLRIDDKTIIADYFVICGANSNTQVKAIAGEVEYKLEEQGIKPHHIEGYNEAVWAVLDYSSVIVHIFNREARDFYKLEKLWSDAEDIDISNLLV